MTLIELLILLSPSSDNYMTLMTRIIATICKSTDIENSQNTSACWVDIEKCRFGANRI